MATILKPPSIFKYYRLMFAIIFECPWRSKHTLSSLPLVHTPYAGVSPIDPSAAAVYSRFGVRLYHRVRLHPLHVVVVVADNPRQAHLSDLIQLVCGYRTANIRVLTF